MQNINLRVVAGKYARRKLVFNLEQEETRPTKDRVRQAVFNALNHQLIGKHVLDLFAGTGAYGIEALSRGAQSCTFVDRSRKAKMNIETNLSFVEEDYEIIISDYLRFLNQPTRVFDIVFVDPPYEMDVEHIFLRLIDAKIVSSNGIVVLESNKALSIDEKFGKIKTYQYGLTHITIIWRNV